MLSPGSPTILACPRCKGELSLLEEGSRLLCRSCNLFYPIREGIPVLLPDEAETAAYSRSTGNV